MTTPSEDPKPGPKFPKSALVSLTEEQETWLEAHVARIETSKSWVLRRGLELYRAEVAAKEAAAAG